MVTAMGGEAMKGFLKRIVAVILAVPVTVVWAISVICGMVLSVIALGVGWLVFGWGVEDNVFGMLDYFMEKTTPGALWNWWFRDKETP